MLDDDPDEPMEYSIDGRDDRRNQYIAIDLSADDVRRLYPALVTAEFRPGVYRWNGAETGDEPLDDAEIAALLAGS